MGNKLLELIEERKESTKVVSAFLKGMAHKEARSHTDGTSMFLHGNKIAWHGDNGAIHATMAGWGTKTTRDRLNTLTRALHGSDHFHQKGGVQHYKGNPIGANDVVKVRESTDKEIKEENSMVNLVVKSLDRRVALDRPFDEAIHIKPSHKGLLHKDLGVKGDKKISVGAEEKAKHSSNPAVRKRATFALNARKWHHEEVEPINEISREKLKKYRNAAEDDIWGKKNTPKVGKRIDGILAAGKRLHGMKPHELQKLKHDPNPIYAPKKIKESESIDEIKKETLDSYRAKATKYEYRSNAEPEENVHKFRNRVTGLAQVAQRKAGSFTDKPKGRAPNGNFYNKKYEMKESTREDNIELLKEFLGLNFGGAKTPVQKKAVVKKKPTKSLTQSRAKVNDLRKTFGKEALKKGEKILKNRATPAGKNRRKHGGSLVVHEEETPFKSQSKWKKAIKKLSPTERFLKMKSVNKSEKKEK